MKTKKDMLNSNRDFYIFINCLKIFLELDFQTKEMLS